MNEFERAVPNLDLKRPIVFFDLETTGLDVRIERIIELALVKVLPDKQVSKHGWVDGLSACAQRTYFQMSCSCHNSRS
jgi:DNA polymerase III epsilon subunit-like protein